ncbi:MAG: nucleotidyltransferase domain-containing protein [Candidatus Thorarchaeota archaeon]|nr:nucleotidyltransferase domain-containing protein [Candidatus Thorarchaeota archaeon]
MVTREPLEVIDHSLETVVHMVREDEDVLGVVVFGSYARGEPYNDVDVCIVLWPSCVESVNPLKKEIKYSEHGLDVSIYQRLPLYIQVEVLKDGVIKYMKDEDAYYDIAIWTIKEWEDFRPRYLMYLETVLDGPKDSK